MLAASLALLCGVAPAGDPVEEAYWRNFYVMPIGRWNAATVNELRNSMFSKTGGQEPAHVKLGVCEVTSFFMQHTQGNDFDYIYEPYFPPDVIGDNRGWELVRMMALAEAQDIRMGSHVNGMPWGDSENQSLDNLHNYLEKAGDAAQGLGPGAYLQRDSSNRMRTGTSTNPSINESFSGGSQLEMQLTLSRNCTPVQNYWTRNARQAIRLLQWYRDRHPDLVTLISGSSEVAQNIHANVAYSDYSIWSKSEFRDWLGGTGLYAGSPQYATITDLNNYIQGGSGESPPGFPLSSFSSAQPPTLVDWSTSTRNGRWWNLWHRFRIAQVTNLVQKQADLSVDCGWSPDRVFGHQVPRVPGSTSDLDGKFATPWTTTFVTNGSNGITTYADDAINTTIFNAMRDSDKSWGIFEWNPLENISTPGTKARADQALAHLWNYKARAVSPFLWDGGLTGGLAVYTIKSRPTETALQDFFAAHTTDATDAMARYEAHPDARSPVWTMSRATDIEASPGFSTLTFSSGKLTAPLSALGGAAALSLRFDESPSRTLPADEYTEVSFRMGLTGPGASAEEASGRFEWTDNTGATGQASFAVPASAGDGNLRVYRVHLAHRSSWRGREITALRLVPTNATAAVTMKLDWVKLEAAPYWGFTDPNEVGGISGFAPGAAASGGTFSGVDISNDGYFYLATDKPAGTDADRLAIDANRYKRVRFSISSSEATNAQIFWRKRGSSFFSRAVPIAAGSQTLDIDMANFPGWDGQITQLRIDPVNLLGTSVTVGPVSLASSLLAPKPLSADLLVFTDHPVFEWDTPIEPDHSGITYELQVARDFEFENLLISRTGLAGSKLVHEESPSLANGDYYWRVRAGASNGNLSAWSIPMPIHLHKWRFATSADVYSTTAPVHVQPSDIATGSFAIEIYTANANDTNFDGFVAPYFFLNTGSLVGRGVNADNYVQFQTRVRIMNATTAVTGARVVFFKEGGPEPFYIAPLPEIPADGEWHNVSVHLPTANPSWKGWVQNVRFDPGQSTQPFTFEVNQAEISPVGAPIFSSVAEWSLY